MTTTKPQISEEKPPYTPYGRYVCDWKLTESHIFSTLESARTFARQWGRDCNIGWLSPSYNAKTNTNTTPTLSEAKTQICKTLKTVIDHR